MLFVSVSSTVFHSVFVSSRYSRHILKRVLHGVHVSKVRNCISVEIDIIRGLNIEPEVWSANFLVTSLCCSVSLDYYSVDVSNY